jgi:hypothetical protein
LNRYSRKIEEAIKKAMKSGAFDNLPGKGEPLDLGDDSYLSDEWRLTHHLLRSNDFTLPWIQRRQEIEKHIEAARATLTRVWTWRQGIEDKQQAKFADGEWQRALENFQQEIGAINENIRDYNLEAPSTRFHLVPLRAEREIDKIKF